MLGPLAVGRVGAGRYGMNSLNPPPEEPKAQSAEQGKKSGASEEGGTLGLYPRTYRIPRAGKGSVAGCRGRHAGHFYRDTG